MKFAHCIGAALLLAAAASAHARAPARIVPTPGGEVVIANDHAARAYEYGYAASRRAGDVLYISGVIVGPAPGEGKDVEAFKGQIRRAYRTLEAQLQANGLGFANVAMINSFHVWDSPHFAGARDQQINAVIAVNNEFMPAAHPAWTAVGTTGLLNPDGIFEIQMIAHYPPKANSKKK